MQCVIVSTSLRSRSNSARVSNVLAEHWEDAGHGRAEHIDLGARPLPMWSETVWSDDAAFLAPWHSVEQSLDHADCLILVSPEYAGMASPAACNFLLFLSPLLVAHRPLMLVGVSHGSGGAYPVAELRGTLHKNNHICVIPEQLIFRDLGAVEDAPLPMVPDWMPMRIKFALKTLSVYARALAPVREALLPLQADFPYGM